MGEVGLALFSYGSLQQTSLLPIKEVFVADPVNNDGNLGPRLHLVPEPEEAACCKPTCSPRCWPRT